eukprot:s377_g24.t1
MCSVQPFCSSTQPVRDGKRKSCALMVGSVMAAANAKCLYLLGLSFFAFPALVSAICFPDDCASCTQAECNLEPGCLDIYPGNFETSCVSCPNTTCLSDGGLDVTAGCSDGINVLVSLTMGLIGGLFAAGMPCICLSIRSQELWAADFLDDRNTEMRRVRGVIKDKKNVDKRGGHAFSVIVEFVAEDLEQQQVPVRAHCASQPAFWSKTKVGGEVEIAYRAGLERDFVIVDDLLTYLMDTSSKYILCICGGCFLVLGVAAGVASWPVTGCFAGIIPLILLMVAGSIAGHFFLKHFAQHITQRHYFVNTGSSVSPKGSDSSDSLQ